jgi:hypothetical protein
MEWSKNGQKVYFHWENGCPEAVRWNAVTIRKDLRK